MYCFGILWYWTGYIAELTGLLESVSPVIRCGNAILDIIVNGLLGIAQRKKIRLEITRCQAPETLPLTDIQTSCLFMNILDNAVNVASEPGISQPFIRLDFHCTEQHFVFSCENSTAGEGKKRSEKSDPQHGYGLKIIRQIMAR